MTARSRRRWTTTSCCGSGRKAGWCNERIDGAVAAVHDSAVYAAVTVADDRRAVSQDGRRGGEAEAGPCGVSGSSAGGRGGRTGEERDCAQESGGKVSEGENTGKFSLQQDPTKHRNTKPQSGRGRLSQPERTDHFHGRYRH